MKLGTLLLRNAAIGLTQLEAALRNQVLYGGRLGTNLIELGFLDLDLLGVYLGEVSGLPVATRPLLDSVPAEILALVGSDLAHELGAIPLAWLADGERQLAVAMIEPNHGPYLDALSAQVGAPIAPYVVAELRAHYYLERHYGRPRQARFVRPGTRPVPGAAADRRRTQPPGGMVLPQPVTITPRSRRASTASPIAAPPVSPSVSLLEAVRALERADHREQIADALVDFGRGRTGALLVFIVRDGNALGWRGHVETTMGAHTRVEALSLPLGGASILQAAHDDARLVQGPPPTPGKTVERTLWESIGAAPEPAEVLAVPVVVRQRVVNLVYAHGLRGGALEPEVVGAITELVEHAQAAYVRLIQAAKR
ncbi:MAG: hypothetical protein R2939_00485 [Kofleriaceae bacterium]